MKIEINKDTAKKINERIKKELYFSREYELNTDLYPSINYVQMKGTQCTTWDQLIRLETLTATIEDLTKMRDIILEVTGVKF